MGYENPLHGLDSNGEVRRVEPGESHIVRVRIGLNELAEEIHYTAVEKGWWPAAEPGNGVDIDMKSAPDRNFAELLMLVVSEAAEALEEYRGGAPISKMLYEDPCTDFNDRSEEPGHCPQGKLLKPVGIPSELADIIIRVLDITAAHGIDIDTAVQEKMAYNATRAYRHGGKVS